MLLRFARDRNVKPETDSIASNHGHNSSPVPASDAADLDLIQRLQKGDHDALTMLFEKHSDMVFGIARRMLRDDGEAEEVVQQVFLDTYRAADQFDHTKASYKTWLFQFAYHRTINRRKHLEARGFYSTEELDERELSLAGAGRALQLSSQEVVHLVEQLLNSIKPRQREAIKLTFFEGLTAEEIAQRTGETPTVVRHNLYRGLSKLRLALLQNERGSKNAAAKNKVEGIFFAPARPL
jgi:RNA polymerase sigma-70 factor (ECF subfamily)